MRMLLVGAALLSSLTLAQAQDAQDKKAVAVVQKAIEAHGGAETLNKYKAATMKIEGQAAIMGLNVDITGDVSYAMPDKFKMVMNIDLMGQKLVIENIANGTAVKSTMNGMALPLPDAAKDELANNAIEQEIAMLTPLLNAEQFTLKSAADADVEGTKAAVVVVSGKRLKDREVKLFFDKEKGQLIKTQRTGLGQDSTSEVEEESFFSEFKKVDGILSPMKIQVKHDGEKFLTFTIKDLKHYETLDAKTFAIDD